MFVIVSETPLSMCFIILYLFDYHELLFQRFSLFCRYHCFLLLFLSIYTRSALLLTNNNVFFLFFPIFYNILYFNLNMKKIRPCLGSWNKGTFSLIILKNHLLRERDINANTWQHCSIWRHFVVLVRPMRASLFTLLVIHVLSKLNWIFLFLLSGFICVYIVFTIRELCVYHV